MAELPPIPSKEPLVNPLVLPPPPSGPHVERRSSGRASFRELSRSSGGNGHLFVLCLFVLFVFLVCLAREIYPAPIKVRKKFYEQSSWGDFAQTKTFICFAKSLKFSTKNDIGYVCWHKKQTIVELALQSFLYGCKCLGEYWCRLGLLKETAVAQTVITVPCFESKKKLIHGQKGGGF